MRPISPLRRGGALLIGLALLAYFAIGLPDGMLGVAWPSMAEDFGVSVPSLGLLLTVLIGGYGIGAALSGRIVTLGGHGIVVTVSAAIAGTGVLGYTLAPNWLAMLGAVLVAGFGIGVMDAGLNVYAALRFSSAATNWMHGFYALGASVGPAVMTGIIVSGNSWRLGFLAGGSMLAAVGIGFLLTRSRWRVDDDPGDEDQAGPATAKMTSTLRLPAVWFSIGMFIIYTGLEVAGGQWTFTVLTEDRGVSEGAAGAWVTAYFVGLTVGRIGIGSLTSVVPATRVIMLSIILSVMAAAVFWADIYAWTGFAAMFTMGLAFGPVFPSLIATTTARVGRLHTPNTVGFQITAAAIGAAALPGGFGIVARFTGLGAIPVAIFAGTVAMLTLFVLMQRSAAKRR